jgi:hypothetical protein
MALYRLIHKVSNAVLRTSDNAVIPFDPLNRDYIVYLAWATAGNAPDAAIAPAVDLSWNSEPSDVNVVHNPAFAVIQRGSGPWTASGYTADRWCLATSNDTSSVSIVGAADVDRSAIARGEVVNVLQIACTGSAAAGAATYLWQGIETVRAYSNYSVTVSFYAKATSGTPSIGVSLDQTFGTGGSSSVTGTGSAVALSTTWTRYSVALVTPLITGKTFGNNDFLQLNLWVSSGNTNASRAAIGVQTATVQLWGIQLEKSAAVSELKVPSLADDYSNARRFYRTLSTRFGWYSGLGGTPVYSPTFFSTPMRSVPAVSYTNTTNTNCSSPTTSSTTQESAVISTTPGLGGFSLATTVVASCDF